MGPFELARRQLEADRAATRAFPALYERKVRKMVASPHAFLRGSAPLFYEILAVRPELAAGPGGEGWIVGDMHLENMGALRDDGGDVTFDLNDFDDATIAPWRLDVLRLLTSTVLAARASGLPAPEAIACAQTLIESHVGAAMHPENTPLELTPAMSALVETASGRSRHDLLDQRAPQDPRTKKRRLSRGERYLDLGRDHAALVPPALAAYVAALGDRAPHRAPSWKIEDAAFRIAGTGSLGRLRMGVLVADDKGEERLLDFKEAAPPSYREAKAQPEAPLASAARVVTGARALLVRPHRLLAAVPLPEYGLSFVARELCPQEDKLEVAALSKRKELEPLASCAGVLLGRAHGRAATVRTAAAWSRAEMSEVVDRALELAGLFKTIYLAYARLSGAAA